MCDVFAVSAGPYSKAHQYLPVVARKAAEPMSGWGIGFFRNNQPCIETNPGKANDSERLLDSWRRLTRVIDSPILVSQISCPSDCESHIPGNRPFSLTFFDHTCLFVQIGRMDRIADYQSACAPRIESAVSSARILEYLRDQLLSYMGSNPYASLHKGLSYGIRRLHEEYAGRHAFLLANESVLFAFSNAVPLMVLRDPATLGRALLITSFSEDPGRPQWTAIRPAPDGVGKLVTVAGPDILHSVDI